MQCAIWQRREKDGKEVVIVNMIKTPAANSSDITQPARPRGKHVENMWKFPPTPRGKHVEIWWKMKQILSWILRGNTWKTRGIHEQFRQNPRGIHVEIRRENSGSQHVEETRRTRVIHVD